MNHTKIYGIKNCDTMKKSLIWLSDHGIEYGVHDYKKNGVPDDILRNAIQAHGWESVINKRGTTWRKLDTSIKASMDAIVAMRVAQEYPSIIKRPLLTHNGDIYLGFKPDSYAAIFNV